MSYNLSVIENRPNLFNQLSDYFFNCGLSEFKKIGEGFYGVVYLVKIQKEPNLVIFKFYKHEGRCLKEKEQLNLLRNYSLVKIPDVYGTFHEADYEVLLMEFAEGINASHFPTDHPKHNEFADEMVNNLLHLHSITSSSGFGFKEDFYPDWKNYYQKRILKLHTAIHSELNGRISHEILKIADESYKEFPIIFSEPVKQSSLVHSDYNLWNILVSLQTGKITAVIDPLDAEFADKEIDLFHLQNADGGRFGLLDRYLSQSTVSELFPVKNSFYRFWDDIKHFYNTGWYDEAVFAFYGKQLFDTMHQYL